MTKEEFKQLFDAYFDKLRSYLVYRGADKDQASDIAQDVFMRIWEKQMEVDPVTALRLLYKMAGNMFISRYRRTELERNYRSSLKSDDMDFSPEDSMRYNQLHDNYTKALAALPDKQRTVFLMARMENLTYQEMADRLNLSVKAIEKRMGIALSYLKKTLLV